MRSRPYPMPGGFSVTFDLTDAGLQCEWSPRMPKGRKGRQVLPYYQAARNEWLRGHCEALGISMLVVDI